MEFNIEHLLTMKAPWFENACPKPPQRDSPRCHEESRKKSVSISINNFFFQFDNVQRRNLLTEAFKHANNLESLAKTEQRLKPAGSVKEPSKCEIAKQHAVKQKQAFTTILKLNNIFTLPGSSFISTSDAPKSLCTAIPRKHRRLKRQANNRQDLLLISHKQLMLSKLKKELMISEEAKKRAEHLIFRAKQRWKVTSS